MTAEIVPVRFEDVDLAVRPSADHEWLLTTAEVAAGLGVSEDSVYQMKSRRSSELAEGRHFVTVDSPASTEDYLTVRQGRPVSTFWTKRGVVRLGFWARSVRARRFRDWAEDLIVQSETSTPGTAVALPNMTALAKADPSAALAIGQALAGLAQANLELEATVSQLAPKAEKFEAIEGGDGIGLRVFHKKYFSAVAERVFMEHLYAKDYLIDQRGKGPVDEETGKARPGSQHRHPTAKGKAFFYLFTGVDEAGRRHENTRVLPGDPELALCDALARDGLPVNGRPQQPGLFEDGAA